MKSGEAVREAEAGDQFGRELRKLRSSCTSWRNDLGEIGLTRGQKRLASPLLCKQLIEDLRP